LFLMLLLLFLRCQWAAVGSGDSARPIDDLDAELARLRAHLKAHRGWRFW
jgi:hypothetical protein